MLEMIDDVIKKEFGKYGFEPFDKDEVKTDDRKAVESSVKMIVAKHIESAIVEILDEARECLEKEEIKLPIAENILVKSDWVDECIILDPELNRIEIEIGDQTNRKRRGYTKVKIRGHTIFYTQPVHKKELTSISTSEEAKKAFKIILKEAKKTRRTL